MPGGLAALLILFGVPSDDIFRVLREYGHEEAPYNEVQAVVLARKIAKEEGYLDD